MLADAKAITPRRKSRVTCLESMNLRKALSFPMAGRTPMANSRALFARSVSEMAILRQLTNWSV